MDEVWSRSPEALRDVQYHRTPFVPSRSTVRHSKKHALSDPNNGLLLDSWAVSIVLDIIPRVSTLREGYWSTISLEVRKGIDERMGTCATRLHSPRMTEYSTSEACQCVHTGWSRTVPDTGV